MLDLRYYRQRTRDGNGDLFQVALLRRRLTEIAFVRLKPSTWEASLMVSNDDGSCEFSEMKVFDCG
jgi:hypothetical protein